MKKLTGLVLVLALTGCSKTVTKENGFFPITERPDEPVPALCNPEALGSLLGFSIYARGEANLSGVNTGKRAAATDVVMEKTSIGNALPSDPTRVYLAAAQTMTVKKVKVPHGQATYGKRLDDSRSSALGGFQKAPFDLSADLQKIREMSMDCNAAITNTSIRKTCPLSPGPGLSPQTCTITISGESRLNIAALSRAELEHVGTFMIDVPNGSTLVTNFPDTQTVIFKSVDVKILHPGSRNPAANSLYWNFPAGDLIELQSTKFLGTFVVPNGNVKACSQNGEGGVWARDIQASDSSW